MFPSFLFIVFMSDSVFHNHRLHIPLIPNDIFSENSQPTINIFFPWNFAISISDKLKSDSATYIDNLSMNPMDADFIGGDESAYDTSNVDVNRIVDNLRDDIKADENIARKSAILLKLLQVSDKEDEARLLLLGENTRKYRGF